MDTAKSIARNTASMYIAQATNLVTGIIFIYFAARHLGAEGIGQYTLGFSYLYIFRTLSQMGLGELLVREIARHKEEASKYVGNAIAIRLVFSALALAGLWILVTVMGYAPITARVVLIIGVSLIPGAVITVGQAAFQSLEKMHYLALIAIVGGMVKLAVGIPLLLSGYGIIAVAVMFFGLSAMSMALQIVFLHRNGIRLSLTVDYAFISQLMRKALPFFVISIFVAIFYRIDSVMLSKMKGLTEVGIYGAAYKFLSIFFMAAGSFNVAIYPILSRTFFSHRDSFDRIFQKALRYELIFLLPIVGLCIILADRIIFLFYGEEFMRSVSVLRILVLTAIPYAVNYTLSRATLSSDNQRVTVRIGGVTVLANVVLNSLLIPRYGASGAAVATLVTFCSGALQNYLFLTRHVLQIQFWSAVARPMLSVMVSVVPTFIALRLGSVLAGCVFLVSYVGMLFFIKGIVMDDIYLFKRAVLQRMT